MISMLGKASEIFMEEVNVSEWEDWKAGRPNASILNIQYTMPDAGRIFVLIIYKEESA
jgi:hypothetical protein